MNKLASIGEFFKDLNYQGWQEHVKIIFLVLTFIFLSLAVYAYVKAHILMKSHRHHHDSKYHEEGHEVHGAAHGEHHEEAPAPTAAFLETWERITQYAQSLHEAEWKLSVIEADKYVDDALRARGFAGETMGERLMLIQPNDLHSLQDLWDAHKLRNMLVHDANFHIRHEQAIAAVAAFENVLRELGALS